MLHLFGQSALLWSYYIGNKCEEAAYIQDYVLDSTQQKQKKKLKSSLFICGYIFMNNANILW